MPEKTVQDHLDEMTALAQEKDTGKLQRAPDLARGALAVFKQRLSNALPGLGFTSWKDFPSGTVYQLGEDTGRLLQLFAQLRLIAKVLGKTVVAKKPAQNIKNPYMEERVGQLQKMLGQAKMADNVTSFHSVYDSVLATGQLPMEEFKRRVQDAIPRMELPKDWEPNKVEDELELLKGSAVLMNKGFNYMRQIDDLPKTFPTAR